MTISVWPNVVKKILFINIWSKEAQSTYFPRNVGLLSRLARNLVRLFQAVFFSKLNLNEIIGLSGVFLAIKQHFFNIGIAKCSFPKYVLVLNIYMIQLLPGPSKQVRLI